MTNLQDKAVEHFYVWDFRLRGYLLFPYPVVIEPPFEPFDRSQIGNEFVDDGRVPTLFERAVRFIGSKKEEPEDKAALPEVKEAQEYRRVALSVKFSRSVDVPVESMVRLFEQLMYTQAPLSFEILANANSLKFQFTCAEHDEARLRTHLKAYLPNAMVSEAESDEFGFNEVDDINILDFGLADESMLPIATQENRSYHDSLSSFIACVEHLNHNECVVLQVLFQGVSAPFAQSMRSAVSDGRGGCFFEGSPEILTECQRKTNSPLFASVIRLATQSGNLQRNQWLSEEFVKSITICSQSSVNQLMVLSNKGYDYDDHVHNLYMRQSNRLGMLLNIQELITFVHYPNSSVVSPKLKHEIRRTKVVVPACVGKPYILGMNIHEGKETIATLDDEQRLRHTHIIGATGTGKSTLIAHLISEDIKAGNGCALFDPHGDIAEEVIASIPENRLQDVIFIDPSDIEYPIGFNLFRAESEVERIVLSSDLLSAFREHATSWGDQMTAIFSNAINAFLEHKDGGTLLEFKRFLLEKEYRHEFLKGVSDPSVLYYFEHEYKLASRSSLMPLLTRIDTFLRPKIIRYMLAQKGGLNFKQVLERKNILIVKLAQGLIGEENCYLLGSLFLAKLLQTAQGRQNLLKEQRHPFYVYIDEFQNFITPSILQILSGARKYGLGLVIAHQELAQIDDSKVLGSVVSNPDIRICFRLGNTDAKRLESSFGSFEALDFQSLTVGEAIVSVGGATSDYSLTCYPPESTERNNIREYIVANTQKRYGSRREDVEHTIAELLPNQSSHTPSIEAQAISLISRKETNVEVQKEAESPKEAFTDTDEETSTFEEQRESYLKQQVKEARDKRHRNIQREIKQLGQAQGFLSTIEKNIAGGKRIDVFLERPDLSIACEVSVSNTVGYEIENIQKCLPCASLILMTSPYQSHLESIEKEAKNVFDVEVLKRIHFVRNEDLTNFIQSYKQKNEPSETTIKGYRVTTEYSDVNPELLKEQIKLWAQRKS